MSRRSCATGRRTVKKRTDSALEVWRGNLARAARRVQPQGGAREPGARRTSCTFRSEGGSAPSETSPQDSLRRQSRRSNVEHCHVRAEDPRSKAHRKLHSPPIEWSTSSAGFARATDSWGRLRRGPSRPLPRERSGWAVIAARAGYAMKKASTSAATLSGCSMCGACPASFTTSIWVRGRRRENSSA